MFAPVSTVIAGLSVAPGCAAVADALVGMERLRAKIVAALMEVDRSGEWATEGDTSLTAWLKRQGVSSLDAVHLARAAVGLRHAPVTAAAYETGDLTGAQIDAVFANVRAAHRDLFAEHEAELVPTLRGLPAKETADAMQAWRQYADAVLDERAPRESELSLTRLPDGRRMLRGDLSPRLGRLLATALGLAHRWDLPDEPTRTAAMRRADALADVCSFFLDHRNASTPKLQRPHLHVGIDLEALRRGLPGETLDGEPVDAAELAVLACDADVRRVLWRGRSSVLDYGHVTRIVPKNLARAVAERDRHCRFPGCDRPAHWSDVHHIVDWYHGGPTVIGNLLLLCGRHHHLLHRQRWRVDLHDDATVTFTLPDGQTRTTRPPPRIRGPAMAVAA